MSQRPIARSSDLKRLRDEGYDIEVKSGHLLIKSVPYLNARKELRRGTLVFVLVLANDIAQKPDNHVAYFAGEHPCHKDGSEITQIKHQSVCQELGIPVDHSFSAKPASGAYNDYYEKARTYVAILSGPAQAIDASATAQVYPVVLPKDELSVFNYIDTASSRAGITAVSEKLAIDRVAIVGLGGTGAYVLDLLAKTPVREIHLFDDDRFLQHNAFRGPGAPSTQDLEAAPLKVDYWRALYSKMHRGVVAHGCIIGCSNVMQLDAMNFVFLSMDGGAPKRLITNHLEARGVPFIDVGMGVDLVDGSLRGTLRVTASAGGKTDHFAKRVSFDELVDNDYDRNIQIADLNALNAALAVVKWKKLCGFYLDFEKEHHSTYTINSNLLTSDDRS